MVPLGIVTLFAYAAGELLRDRPIFDAILEDDLKVRFPKTAKKDQLQRNPYVYEAADVYKRQVYECACRHCPCSAHDAG